MKLSNVPVQQNHQNSGLESLAAAVSEMSVEELEKIVGNLRESLDRARQFVSEQEEELAEQVRALVDLEAELPSASESNRQALLQKLTNEKERREMLEATLIGQRDNLQQQEVIYEQYWKLLEDKKQYLQDNSNKRSIDLNYQHLFSKPPQNSHLFSSTEQPVFNLLSLGERGAGKTVFLAGSYAYFSSRPLQETSPAWWLKCQDSQEREDLDSLLNYIAKTGEYPPATMKISSFNFSLKHRNRGRTNTLCHFRWWDIPGEYCDFRRPEFQQMVLDSQGCCIFIDACRLVGEPSYLNKLEPLLNQVKAIASLVDFETLPYSFALILTKCDRLDLGPISRLQIEEKLQSLFACLEAARAKYRRFYSSIPIINKGDRFALQPKGTAEAFLWLATELEKSHKSHPERTLATALKPEAPTVPTTRTGASVWRWAIAALGLLGVGVAAWFAFSLWLTFSRSSPTLEAHLAIEEQIQQYEKLLQRNPNNLKALEELTTLYVEQGQLEAARPLMEKIVQQNPQSLEWQLNLASLYELTQNWREAEAIYDRILAGDNNNFRSLLAKAYIRSKQGDMKTASALFQQAERMATSSELKAKVREMAQEALKKTD